MTESQPDDGMCQETSGFLFNHPCDRFAVQKCKLCQKPLCDDHAHLEEEGVFCTTCLKSRLQGAAPRDPRSSTGSTRYGRRYYDDDPYFYRDHYYGGYDPYYHSVSVHHSESTPNPHRPDPQPAPTQEEAGYSGGGDFDPENPAHDPADFTEGDADSVRHEGDENFESDMGAS